MVGLVKVNGSDQLPDPIRRQEPATSQSSLVPKGQRATERMVVRSDPPKRSEKEHSSVEYLEEHHIAMKLNEIVPWCLTGQWK